MLYRFLLAMLVVFVAVACGDSSRELRAKNASATPTLPAEIRAAQAEESRK